MHSPGSLLRLAGTVLAVLAGATGTAAGQQQETKRPEAAPEAVLEVIAEPALLEPSAVPPVNPLFRPFDRPPKLVELPAAQDFRGKATLFLALKLDETGKVVQAEAVDPPLRGLVPAAVDLALSWTFEPARKDGKPVRTWASYGLDLALDIERPVFTSFALAAIGKDDPIPAVFREFPGESGLLRFPPTPGEADVVSIEDVDFLPSGRRNPWKFDTIRLKSRLSAVLQISPTGAVERVIATGGSAEPFVVSWVRSQAAKWKIQPASDGGVPQRSFMTLDLVAEYEITRAKESARRLLKKNLKGSPAG